MEVLKVKIYQPQAHYRVPFTFQRRHTYPIPPYSTVKGMLCNLLGIRKGIEVIEENNMDNRDLLILNKMRSLKISICGSFESKTSEYTWFRNLSKKSHLDRFGYPENRKVSCHVEHPGGQIPVTVDILNEVRIKIYLYHEERDFLERIKSAIENPAERLSPLHLGRAEDIIMIQEVNYAVLDVVDIEGDYKNFFWIPENPYIDENCMFKFDAINGLSVKLPTFYEIVNGRRNFKYINAKLNDGDLGGIRMFFDNTEELPVFLLKIT